MKLISVVLVCLFSSLPAFSQEVIELPFANAPSVKWTTEERQYYSSIWQTEVITNVSTPTLLAFRPDPEFANGTSVIIAPGGALYAHSISSEGRQVAQWLVEKGITAFVLKYRLVPTGQDGVKEATDDWGGIGARVEPVLPLAINDGLEAVNYVRSNAKELGLDPNKIGFMGFSAGGAVTMGVTYNYTQATRPNFIVPVYAWTEVFDVQDPPVDAPPMLVVCASDDSLGLAPSSVQLYSQWLAKGKTAGLHMYSKGGHGFGMRKLNLPSDSWIERFYDWAMTEGFVTQIVQ
ncbi:MAG: acetyl esterase/lipase [Cryomorphaceae bacterium]|jgi:acetyl esterase/lipase